MSSDRPPTTKPPAMSSSRRGSNGDDAFSVATGFSEPFPDSKMSAKPKKSEEKRVIDEEVGEKTEDSRMTAGQARWAHYATDSTEDADDDFSTAESVGSTFSTPATYAEASKATTSRPGAVHEYPANHPAASGGRVALKPIQELQELTSEQPGAHPEISSRVQRLLERKYAAHTVDEEEVEQSNSALPRDLQSLLERKFQEFDGEEAAKSSKDHDAHSAATEVVANKKKAPVKETKADGSQSTCDESMDGSASSDDDEVGRHSVSMSGSGASHSRQRRRSTVLDSQALDGQGRTLSPSELKELWVKTGMCTECGRVKTHAKVKCGLFWAFRKMEPITTRGQVYKGYCLFCYEVEDLRRLLNEPELREEDVPRSEAAARMLTRLTSVRNNEYATNEAAQVHRHAAPTNAFGRQYIDHMEEAAVAVAPDPKTLEEEQETKSILHRNWKPFLVVGLVLVALIVGAVVAAVLALGGGGDGESSSPANSSPRPPQVPVVPTPSPTFPLPEDASLIWTKVGPDIAGTAESFGRVLALSQDGRRLAVSSPSDSGGRVDVYESVIIGGSKRYVPVGNPIVGVVPADEAGFGMSLSPDGTTLAVGSPGIGRGHVRVFRYSDVDVAWMPLGAVLEGTSEGGRFGHSVSLNEKGNILVVGAPYHIINQVYSTSTVGRVQAFELKNGGTWVEMGQELLGDNDQDLFGTSVQVDHFGLLIAVGAPGSDEGSQEGGQLHLFVFNKERWDKGLPLEILGAENQMYGQHFALSGKQPIFAISAVDDDVDGIAGAGDVRVIHLDFVNVVANQLGTGISPQPDSLGLGYSMGIDKTGHRLILSGVNGETSAGNVFVYQYDQQNDLWVKLGDEIVGDKLGTQEWLGRGPAVSISSDGNTIAVGYESLDMAGSPSLPVVRVYSFFRGAMV